MWVLIHQPQVGINFNLQQLYHTLFSRKACDQLHKGQLQNRHHTAFVRSTGHRLTKPPTVGTVLKPDSRNKKMDSKIVIDVKDGGRSENNTETGCD